VTTLPPDPRQTQMSEGERRLRASAAAHTSWANTDNRSARTAPARAALDAKFLEQAQGDPVRATHFRKAHFARLALKSAQSRRRAKVLTDTADAAEAELDALGGDPRGASAA
jgi:hypothetical protein